MSTIFQKIIDKEIKADIVYEDDKCLAFKDINPQAPTHLLLIPKKAIPTLQDINSEDAELMGHMMAQIPNIAQEAGLADNGYRVVINCKDDGGQEVYHIHFHILGGRSLNWPPG